MARYLKSGLDYFPLNVDIDQDDKMALIEAQYGIVGFGIVIKLLMKIYSEGYFYHWTEKEQLLFSRRINVDINTVNECINDCIKWNLFDKTLFEEYGVLTSKGIQSRYFEAIKRRQRIEVVKEFLLLDEKTLNAYNNLVYVDINGINVDINKQRKEKKSKEKKRKENRELSNDNSMSVGTDAPAPEPTPVTSQKVDYEAIMQYWNERSMLKPITAMTDKRKGHVGARIREHGLEAVYKVIDNCGQSSFMRGNNARGWQATFDWVFLPNNFVKVFEGNYLDEARGSKLTKFEQDYLETLEELKRSGFRNDDGTI